jgi:dCMP deaminase
MKDKFLQYYMSIAEATAQLSSARRLKVGSVIVRDHQIIGTGYNGTPAGWDNNCEDVEWCSAGGWLDPEEIEEGWPHEGTYLDRDGNEMKNRYRLITKPEVIHSEMNSLMKIAKSTSSSEGASLFVTHSPCLECAKAIYQSGIKEVFYRESYKSSDGIYFLEKCGIKIKKML